MSALPLLHVNISIHLEALRCLYLTGPLAGLRTLTFQHKEHKVETTVWTDTCIKLFLHKWCHCQIRTIWQQAQTGPPTQAKNFDLLG